MADSTKINQLQEKLLEANSIITNKIIEGISFDKTITCNIIDDTYKKEGKYTVSSGAQKFTAYSTVTNYSVNNTVYVTIPNGDYENQKIIIGKKTSDEDKPFVFTTPFDTMVDLTGNKISSLNWSALANEKDVRVKKGNTASFKELSLASYTRLGISANFQTWIGEAVTGNYGLKFILHTRTQNTIGVAKKETDKDYYKYSDYDIYLQVSDMYGNPYNFESYYNQQKVIDITSCGEIIGIDIELFQDGDFVDALGAAVPSTDGMDIRLFDNIFVKDIYICAGNDISELDTDYVKLYTTSKTTYAKEERTTNKKIPTRELELRWVHLFDGNPKQIKELDSNSEIHWYRYHVGAAAADDYCGVYWEDIFKEQKDKYEKEYNDDKAAIEENFENGVINEEEKEKQLTEIKKNYDEKIEEINQQQRQFSITVDLNTEQQQEKFKAIAFYNSTPYRSNEVVFDNEEIVPSQETIIKQNALAIETDDETDGNYLFYSQNGRLIESQDSNKTRGLYLSFDPTGTNRTKLSLEDYDNVTWTLPKNNTMFRWLNISSDDKSDKYIGPLNLPQYKIATNYQAGNNDNIITAEYTVEGRTYKAVKEFAFGKFGTMGSLQTLEVDWVDPNVTAIKVPNSATKETQQYKVQVKVYDKDGKVKSNISGVTWSWYDWYENGVRMSKDKSPQFIQTSQAENDPITILTLEPTSELKHDYLYILKVAVGDLETYFSIPLYSGNCTHIEGSKEIYYQANGIPEQYKTPYQIYNGNSEILNNEDTKTVVTWDVIPGTTIDSEKQYIPILDKNTKTKLQVFQTYIENAPLYGVSCTVTKNEETYAQWTQPILVVKNAYSSGKINNWDGKSLVLDNEDNTILATAIAAGSKDSQNRFSGVMIGDWSKPKVTSDGTEKSISKQTGVYGLHEGEISYAFMDDGTAFIGKDGKGRINFNGNNSTIYSAFYKEKTNSYGMMIDLGGDDVPYIDMKYGSSNQITLGINKSEEIKDRTPYLHMNANVSKKTYPLAIGDNFKVDWEGTLNATNGEFSGKIEADSGHIGGWLVGDGDYVGSLLSVGETIILNPTSGGSIIINGESQKKSIVLSGQSGTMTLGAGITFMGNTSEIHLEANAYNDNSYSGPIIILQGNDQIGGIGFLWGSEFKEDGTTQATSNIGLRSYSNHSIILKSEKNIRLTVPKGQKIIFDCEAKDQEGIYARFA